MRKRMYKAGKSWVVAAATFAATAMIASGGVSANDTNQQNNATLQVSPTKNDNSVVKNTTSTANVAKVDTTTDNTRDISSANNVNNLITNQYKENSNGSWSYYDNNGQIVKGLQTINGNIQYFDSTTGEQVKGQTLTIDGVIYSFDKDSGNGTKTEVASLPTTGSYATKDGSNWQYEDQQQQPIKGLYTDKGNLRYFNETDGTQAKGTVVSVDNNTYYFDKDSGNGQLVPSVTGGQYGTIQLNNQTVWVYRNANGEIVKGLQNINGNIQYFDPTTGEQLKGKVATVNGVTYYFEASDGNLVGTVSDGLVTVNGQIQYFDPATGEQAKNKQVIVNNVTYYFDDNGYGQYLFTNAISSTTPDAYSAHTQAYNTDQSSFTNVVDGFLTADSWYRPKEVIADATGSAWQTSSENDYRPIITVWWPNKNVEVNYLKLMQDNDLLSTQTQFTIFSDQYTLNEAAQAAQNEIEKRIYREKSTDWLKDLLFEAHGDTPSFVKQQFIWNKDSEYQGAGGGNLWSLQGGYLKYVNDSETSWSDSTSRKHDYYEYLLGNDIDNSNPQVIAENINWLYYLMNFGSLTGNDDTANFDGVRMDAVIYMKGEASTKVYQFLQKSDELTKNEKIANEHISIVEDGTDETTKNNSALIVSKWNENIASSLAKIASGKDTSLEALVKTDEKTSVSRIMNSSVESDVNPNYSMIRSHDRGSQDEVINASKVANNDQSIALDNINLNQLENGLKLYYEDQASPTKNYNYYNIPASYALLLSNKDTVPRLYYSDMYQDYDQNQDTPQQYMSKPTIYYSAIDALLKARIKYVAGGQSMAVEKVGDNKDQEVLTSVRYGKNVMTATDTGTVESRTEGMGVIVSNNTKLKLSTTDQIVLHMGAAHANQAYQALMLTNDEGIQLYNDNAPVVWTDHNGDLVFNGNDINGQKNTSIKGYFNPQVAGYLAVWVPVGATDTQDARTKASTNATTDGKVFHSNAALDSNVIYEGFSNFQPIARNHNDFSNVKIAENVDLFKKWGITSFELAPQYRSADVSDLVGSTFVDVVTKNGYGLSDRYDLGFVTPTKYGSDSDLRNAISSLHAQGIQAMADFVGNQIYALNDGQEVVTAQRSDMFNNTLNNAFGTELYVVNSIGGGKYQAKYGGNYLEEIANLYPDLFTNQDGTKIDINTKIKQWSAKYMNGTNVLGRGMGYVLKDWNTATYFKLDGEHTVLPAALTLSGLKVENGVTYYYKNNERQTGTQTVDDVTYFFDPKTGAMKKDYFDFTADNKVYYYGNDGVRYTNRFYSNWGNMYYFGEDGARYTNRFYSNWGNMYYFGEDGARYTNRFYSNWGKLYYFGNDGARYTNQSYSNWGKTYYFGNDGARLTNQFRSDSQGKLYYYGEDGARYTNQFYSNWGKLYYFGNDGARYTNQFYSNWGKTYYFGNDGARLTNQFYSNWGNKYYFDNNGVLVTNKTIVIEGTKYIADAKGILRKV
ncbi:glycoside hydrolase family 70 protein [Leuconostoc suionicum]|uniref:glycoside hydrolase family 70 protein n=1 Tax=Leuconostoc suionicum TaxID=1511761 RepID=UPI00300DAD93